MVKLWTAIIILMFVAGVVLRVWRRHLAPVRLQKVSVPVAVTLVGEFLASCYDGQFGFPSGLFQVEQVAPNRLVAREFTSRSSHFISLLVGFYRAVFTFLTFLGFFGLIVAVVLAVLLTPVLLYAAATEVALRYLLRSEITADFHPAEDGTAVLFTLRGPVALLVGRRLENAFNRPVLPPLVAAAAGLPRPAAA